MKKLVLTSLILLFAAIVNAAPVTQEKTLQLATFFFHEHGGNGDLQLVENTTYDHLRIYTASEGFVIISSDDCVLPILGYSASNPLDIDNMSAGTRYWLQEYENQILYNINNVYEASATVRNEWSRLEKMIPAPQQAPAKTSTFNTANLLSTTWAQDPYYNTQCPYDSEESAYTLTGCVATAMGQIMKYWGHPLRGVGSYTYTDPNYGTQSANFADTVFNYSIMPNKLNSYSTAAQVNAVALLLRRCGIGAEVYYGVDGSGATTNGKGYIGYTSAENAYREYFKYMHTVHSVALADYTDSAWVALLKNEIDNGRPTQYSAGNEYTGGGHSFICCGYDNTGKLYFNWGWGGYCDGYFLIGQLNPGSSHYNARNKAIIGIIPDTTEAAQTTITLVANPQNAGTVTGSGTYTSYQDTATILATANAGYLFSDWGNTLSYNPYEFLANGGNVTLTANFEKMHGDTLGYCYEANQNSYGGSSSSTRIWAIRLDSNSIAPGKMLTRVQAYISESGNYKVHIFQGNAANSSSLVLSDTLNISTSQEETWVDIALSDTVRVNRSLPLWIALEVTGSGYPRSYSAYRGNPDGAWTASSIDGTWTNYVTYYTDTYIAFQIRGVFTTNEELFNVTVSSDNSTMGSVTGGGTYSYGSTATITATANAGYKFSRWNDNDTSAIRQFTVIEDKDFTAYFEALPTGIDNASVHEIIAYATDHRIIIENAAGHDIRIYDATGKLVTSVTASSDRESLTLAPGVYFVRINGKTNKLIIK